MSRPNCQSSCSFIDWTKDSSTRYGSEFQRSESLAGSCPLKHFKHQSKVVNGLLKVEPGQVATIIPYTTLQKVLYMRLLLTYDAMNLEHDTSRTTLCGPSVTFTLVNMSSSHTLPQSTNPISKTGWTKDPKAELEEWCHGGTALREPRASRAMQWTPFPGTFEYAWK